MRISDINVFAFICFVLPPGQTEYHGKRKLFASCLQRHAASHVTGRDPLSKLGSVASSQLSLNSCSKKKGLEVLKCFDLKQHVYNIVVRMPCCPKS